VHTYIHVHIYAYIRRIVCLVGHSSVSVSIILVGSHLMCRDNVHARKTKTGECQTSHTSTHTRHIYSYHNTHRLPPLHKKSLQNVLLPTSGVLSPRTPNLSISTYSHSLTHAVAMVILLIVLVSRFVCCMCVSCLQKYVLWMWQPVRLSVELLLRPLFRSTIKPSF
jgi:hypothetical protein